MLSDLGRSAKDAVQRIKEYAEQGYTRAVVLDLSKYFDTLNHEFLVNILRRDVKDERVIQMIKRYLKSGVMENGVEVSREQVNSSTYKMVPRSATVGTATSDPQAYEEIMAAISTANIDHVKNVAAALNARAAAAAGQTEIVDD